MDVPEKMTPNPISSIVLYAIMNIPEGYDIIAEGICIFDDSPKYYFGRWYFNEEVNIYFFLLAKDIEQDEDKDINVVLLCLVEEENMIYNDDYSVYGWFSKTMENYTFVILPESDDDEGDEDDEEPEGFWQSSDDVAESEEE